MRVNINLIYGNQKSRLKEQLLINPPNVGLNVDIIGRSFCDGEKSFLQYIPSRVWV